MLARALRLRGLDVTTSQEQGLLGTSDREQLESARLAGRVVVTLDADFAALHHAGVDRAGIGYAEQGRRSLGDIIDLIVLAWEILDPDHMRNRLEYF